MDENLNKEPETVETETQAEACDCGADCSCEAPCTCDAPACDCNDDEACECGDNCECHKAPESEDAEKPARPKREPRPTIEITDAYLSQAAETLSAIIGFLGLNGEVRAQKKDNKIVLAVNSTDAGRIIGRKGQNLESIQFLLARILVKGEQAFPRIVIDIDGYARNGGVFKEGFQRRPRGERFERGDRGNDRRPRGRGDRSDRGGDRGFRKSGGRNFEGGERREFVSAEREETLKQQALDYAKEVVKWGEPITLPPMSAQERRIIHMALENNTEIATNSIGEGVRKSIVISQK